MENRNFHTGYSCPKGRYSAKGENKPATGYHRNPWYKAYHRLCFFIRDEKMWSPDPEAKALALFEYEQLECKRRAVERD